MNSGACMNLLEKLKVAVIASIFAIGIGAAQTSGSAETAGKELDQATRKAHEKAEQASERIGEEGRKTATIIDDTVITAKVKAAIFAEPDLKTLQINVTTVQGVVTLNGSVDSQVDKERAKEIAGAVAGVTRVENGLVVKTPK